MSSDLIEWIRDGDDTLGVIVRADYVPDKTTFLTPDDYLQQLGFIVYPEGSEIPKHDHRDMERTIRGTSECLMIKKGKAEVTFYNRAREEVCRKIIGTGDVLLLVGGGHGFRQLEDTVYLEIKQGPYPGVQEKERF